MSILRYLKKNIYLRIVNFVGLFIMLACLLLSAGYIRYELSYDRHHTNADRIVRISLQFNNDPVDGRILGNALDDILLRIPEIEQTVKIDNIRTNVLVHQGKHHVVKNCYLVSPNFLQVFDIPLLWGESERALDRPGKVIISEGLARQLFGEIDFETSEMSFELHGYNYPVSGIFKDIPEASHFHTDVLFHLPNDDWSYAYTYLLLKANRTDIDALARKITEHLEDEKLSQSVFSQPTNSRALLMPLTDIHLHSHNLREMGGNGKSRRCDKDRLGS